MVFRWLVPALRRQLDHTRTCDVARSAARVFSGHALGPIRCDDFSPSDQ